MVLQVQLFTRTLIRKKFAISWPFQEPLLLNLALINIIKKLEKQSFIPLSPLISSWVFSPYFLDSMLWYFVTSLSPIEILKTNLSALAAFHSHLAIFPVQISRSTKYSDIITLESLCTFQNDWFCYLYGGTKVWMSK